MAAVFGLVAAILWGISDLFSRQSARQLGAWRSIFYGQLPGLIIFTAWLFFSHAAREKAASASHLYWVLAVIGSFGTAATAYLLSRAFIDGAVTLVVPVAASYGAVSALLSIATGERLSLAALAGILLCIAGVLGSVFSQKDLGENQKERSWSGLGWAIASAFCYGTTLWLEGKYVLPRLGPPVVLGLASYVGLALTIIITRIERITLFSSPSTVALVNAFSYGTLSSAAFCVLIIGLAAGDTAIVSVLSTLSSTITAVIGFFLFKEHIQKVQWLGIGLILLGVILVNIR